MDADGRPSQDRRRSGGGEGGRVPQTARSRGGDVGEPSRKTDLMHHLYAPACAPAVLPFPVPSRRLRLRLLAPSHARLRCMFEKATVAIREVTDTLRIGMQSKDVQDEIVASQLRLSARMEGEDELLCFLLSRAWRTHNN